MPGRRHSPDEIFRKLQVADEMRARGSSTREICREIDVAENTFQRWKHQYGGLNGRERRRLTELEEENRRLKQLVASLSLDLHAAKEYARCLEDNGSSKESLALGRNGAASI